jgi:hypothetical protein
MTTHEHGRPSVRKYGLRLFLGLVAVNALIGVIGILGASFDDTVLRIFLTSLTLTLGVLLALAASVAERVPALGVLWMVGIAGTPQIIAAGVGVVGILSLARLSPAHEWVGTTTLILVAVLTLMSIVALWGEIEDGAFWRVFGVGSVLAAAGAITIPVLSRAGRAERAATARQTESVRFCPSCGNGHVVEVGRDTRCPACGVRFRIDILSR